MSVFDLNPVLVQQVAQHAAAGERTLQVQSVDVDFLVELPRGYDLFAQRLPLAERLADLLGRRVAPVPKDELNRHNRGRVLKEAAES